MPPMVQALPVPLGWKKQFWLRTSDVPLLGLSLPDVHVHLIAATRHNRKHMFGATPASVPSLCMVVKTSLSQESRSQTITWVSLGLFPPSCWGWNSCSLCLLHMRLVLGWLMPLSPLCSEAIIWKQIYFLSHPTGGISPPSFLVCFSIKKLKLPIEPPEVGVGKLCFWFTRISGVLSFFHSFACVTRSAFS